MKKSKYNFDGKIYKSNDLGFTPQYCTVDDVKLVLHYAANDADLVGNNQKIYYFNIPCSFDIETSSFYRDLDGKTYDYKQKCQLKENAAKLEKLSIMYIWQFGINGYIFIGRTWNEFCRLIAEITAILGLNENRRLIVYVHNLAFEFQFICKLFNWQKVFSLDLRKPLYAITGGIEFRCSYLLSGYSLDTVAKNLQKYRISKLVGNLDYELIRHEKTPLTDAELNYCVNDVKIVMLYILEYIENVKNLHNVPLTKTGAVRKFCRKNCFFIPKTDTEKTKVNYQYKSLMNDLQINDLSEFATLQRAFCGGFTHANANYVNETINNVTSYDFTSSYPYVMISEKFPMTKGVKINVKSKKQFEFLISKYLCVFDIEFTNIFSNVDYDNYISVSKCFIRENIAENNGRLVSAAKIALTVTNVDFTIIRKMYNWQDYKIGFMYVYNSDYLPTEFIKSIVTLYKKKTELKGVNGMETEYLGAKEMLNSCYGMCVTNPLRNEIIFDVDGWRENELNEIEQQKMLDVHNTSKSRFLYYIWGVFVTAFARRNLWTAIFELKQDYIYSDTDSVKFLNFDKHKTYFETYNKIVEMKLKNACQYHGINFADVKPLTIKGTEKMLGVWDFDGFYEKFKTLGAKRYMIKETKALNVNGVYYDYSLTVSGVNKKYAIPYLLETYGESGIFDAFTNYLHLPPDAVGKNISTYVDYETSGTITDYNGITADFNAKSGVHLEKTDYNLSLSVLFMQYLSGIKIMK